MLVNLHVKNIALINEVEIDLEEGFNVLSGETGAGKSLIIDSVNFALGSKVPKDIVREDSDHALVELTFTVRDQEIKDRLKELMVDVSDDQVLLSRKLTKGRSILRVNGESMTIAQVREIAALLIDIHGQHEHQSLLYKKKHGEILDEYCKESLSDKLKSFRVRFEEYNNALKELEEEREVSANLEKETAFLEFEINEIRGAALEEGEDEELEASYRKMQNSKKLMEAVSLAHRLSGNDSEEGAGSLVGRGVKSLGQVTGIDPALDDIANMLGEVEDLLNDFSRTIAEYEQGLEYSEEEYARVEERLNVINKLKDKYGSDIKAIKESLKEKEDRYEKLIDHDSYVNQLEEKVKKDREDILKRCREISEIRRKAARKLSKEIEEGVMDLNFLDAKFEISIDSNEDRINSLGFDEVEFMISTNPGEKIKPLVQVASGGELSRIMLALKSVLAAKDRVSTLIFDEIDTGISGRTAQKVSEKLALLAKTHQVICITHLPQIAAMADAHFEIEKGVTDGRTETNIRQLSREEIVKELARMLSGAKVTDAVLGSAREMKELADRVKARDQDV
ncbi:MAG: DNA repair protein RecN [Lachnospiraceae bacterium]|nr:DNA repair protein RecN [Lachnospiraceae bacterium]